MKTLYIHIGTPKTATTSIQNFCAANRKILLKKGYCYPKFPYKYPGKGAKRNGLFLEAVSKGADGKRDEAREGEILKEGLSKIKALFDNCDSVILSDEGIWAASYKRRKSIWKELIQASREGGYSLKIIVYLRRQDTFIDSRWNQFVKEGSRSDTFAHFLQEIPESNQLDYYEALEKIASDVGRENIIVRRFERGSFIGGSVEADFLDAVGLELDDSFIPAEKEHNLRLAGNTHEIKRVINEMPELDAASNRFFWDALEICSPQSEKYYPASAFSREEAQAFVEQFKHSNDLVAKQYMKSDRPLFSDEFKDCEKWVKDNRYQYDDLVRFCAACNMLVVKRYVSELEHLRAELQKKGAFKRKLKKLLTHPVETVSNRLSKYRYGSDEVGLLKLKFKKEKSYLGKTKLLVNIVFQTIRGLF